MQSIKTSWPFSNIWANKLAGSNFNKSNRTVCTLQWFLIQWRKQPIISVNFDHLKCDCRFSIYKGTRFRWWWWWYWIFNRLSNKDSRKGILEMQTQFKNAKPRAVWHSGTINDKQIFHVNFNLLSSESHYVPKWAMYSELIRISRLKGINWSQIWVNE